MSSEIKEGENGLEICIHPLVLINVADHILRVRSSSNDPNVVVGILLGSINARSLEIYNTFELATCLSTDSKLTPFENHLELDLDFFQLRLSQFQEVFSDLDFVGWYRVNINEDDTSQKGNLSPTAHDVDILGSLNHLNINPYVMLVEVILKDELEADLFDKHLPVRMFERFIIAHNKEMRNYPQECFRQVDFVLTSLEAERIAVDHVSKKGIAAEIVAHSKDTSDTSKQQERIGHVDSLQHDVSGDEGSQINLPPTAASTDYAMHLNSLSGAVEMMLRRLKVIRLYLEAVKAGRIQKDNSIIRGIAAICDSRKRQLKEADDDRNCHFADEFSSEYDSGITSVYLSVLTSFTSNFKETAEIFKNNFDKRYFRDRFIQQKFDV